MSPAALQKNTMIERLKDQNDRLKSELTVLTEKLEEFVQKSKAKKQQKLDMKRKGADEDNEIIKQKKAELSKVSINIANSFGSELNSIRYKIKSRTTIKR